MAADWTSHFSRLYCNFLVAAPELAGLVKTDQDKTGKLERPRLVVKCLKLSTNHPKMWKGELQIQHCIQVTQDGDEPDTAAEINAAITARLADAEAWRAFIQAMPVQDRTGWMITRAMLGQWDHEDDEEKHTRDYLLVIELGAIVAPEAV